VSTSIQFQHTAGDFLFARAPGGEIKQTKKKTNKKKSRRTFSSFARTVVVANQERKVVGRPRSGLAGSVSRCGAIAHGDQAFGSVESA